jgi:tetratricopeptide (TPR) repeat protein
MIARCGLLLLLLPATAGAQSIVPPARPLSRVVEQLHQDAFLTDAERRALHRHHGTWELEDLLTSRQRAEAALQIGHWDAQVFEEPDLPPVLAARAAWRRGERRKAFDLLAEQTDQESRSLAGRVAFELGEIDQSNALLMEVMQGASTSIAEEIARIRAARQYALTSGRTGEAYQSILDALAAIRDEQDALCWEALLEEVDVLAEKHRYNAAADAAWEALELNPRLSMVWYQLGQLAVRMFDFEGAASAAQSLRRLVVDHPLAAIIDAEVAIVRRDVESAQALLAPVLVRYPQHPEALALAIVAAELSNQEQLSKHLEDRVRSSAPGDPRPFTTVGRLLALHRQFEQADTWLQMAMALQPRWAAAYVEQGLMRWQAGDDSLAMASMIRAVELDPFNVRAANSLSLLQALGQYESLETPHFIIRWAPGVDEALVRDMPEQLEAMHDELHDRLEWSPEGRTTVELYPDHESFAVRVVGMPDIHTVAACTGPVIAMEVPRTAVGTRHLGLYDWVNVLQHEYTHTLTLDRTNYRLPLWLTEGLAVSMEVAPRSWETRQLLAMEWAAGTLLDPDELNWGFVRPQRPQDRSLAYAQSWLMVDYLLSQWGKEGLGRLLDVYRDGVQESNAFPAALGISRDRFHLDFLAWAGEQFQAWGLLAVPSIAELATELFTSDARNASRLHRRQREAMQRGMSQLLEQIGHPADDARPMGAWKLPSPLDLSELKAEAIESMLATYASHPDLLYESIRHWLDQGHPVDDVLLDRVVRYVRLRPMDPAGHRLLADIRLESSPADAVEHLRMLAQRATDDPSPWVSLAQVQRSLGDHAGALDSARRALRIDPYDPQLRERVAAFAVEAQALECARHQVEALLLLEPGQPLHERRLQAIDAMLDE